MVHPKIGSALFEFRTLVVLAQSCLNCSFVVAVALVLVGICSTEVSATSVSPRASLDLGTSSWTATGRGRVRSLALSSWNGYGVSMWSSTPHLVWYALIYLLDSLSE